MLPAASASVLSAAVKALHSGIITSDAVLSKTAIFPKKERIKREISNESVIESDQMRVVTPLGL